MDIYFEEQNGEYALIGYNSKRLQEAVKYYWITELQLSELVFNVSGFCQLPTYVHFEFLVNYKPLPT